MARMCSVHHAGNTAVFKPSTTRLQQDTDSIAVFYSLFCVFVCIFGNIDKKVMKNVTITAIV